jgi:hypothetical protein
MAEIEKKIEEDGEVRKDEGFFRFAINIYNNNEPWTMFLIAL